MYLPLILKWKKGIKTKRPSDHIFLYLLLQSGWGVRHQLSAVVLSFYTCRQWVYVLQYPPLNGLMFMLPHSVKKRLNVHIKHVIKGQIVNFVGYSYTGVCKWKVWTHEVPDWFSVEKRDEKWEMASSQTEVGRGSGGDTIISSSTKMKLLPCE